VRINDYIQFTIVRDREPRVLEIILVSGRMNRHSHLPKYIQHNVIVMFCFTVIHIIIFLMYCCTNVCFGNSYFLNCRYSIVEIWKTNKDNLVLFIISKNQYNNNNKQ